MTNFGQIFDIILLILLVTSVLFLLLTSKGCPGVEQMYDYRTSSKKLSALIKFWSFKVRRLLEGEVLIQSQNCYSVIHMKFKSLVIFFFQITNSYHHIFFYILELIVIFSLLYSVYTCSTCILINHGKIMVTFLINVLFWCVLLIREMRLFWFQCETVWYLQEIRHTWKILLELM